MEPSIVETVREVQPSPSTTGTSSSALSSQGPRLPQSPRRPHQTPPPRLNIHPVPELGPPLIQVQYICLNYVKNRFIVLFSCCFLYLVIKSKSKTFISTVCQQWITKICNIYIICQEISMLCLTLAHYETLLCCFFYSGSQARPDAHRPAVYPNSHLGQEAWQVFLFLAFCLCFCLCLMISYTN